MNFKENGLSIQDSRHCDPLICWNSKDQRLGKKSTIYGRADEAGKRYEIRSNGNSDSFCCLILRVCCIMPEAVSGSWSYFAYVFIEMILIAQVQHGPTVSPQPSDDQSVERPPDGIATRQADN